MAPSVLRFWRGIIPYPSLRSRTVLVLWPVHLLAFVALYLGMVQVVRNEILATHSRDARLLLHEAVRDLHPYMAGPDRAEIPVHVDEFARSHALLDLHIFRSDGTMLSESGRPDPGVAKFLGAGEEERFAFAQHAGLITLRGMARIRSEDSCVECHEAGEELGVATMALDLTREIGAAQSHLRRNLAVLVAGWALIVGVFNVSLAAWTRRSLARLHGDLPSPAAAEATHIPSALLDPVAGEIYASLHHLLEERKQRSENVSSRLRHTDRLASLGQLAAGLAHEIKNPLAGIRGVIELLRDETDDGERRDLYQQMVAELDRVNGTIHSLLHFARPGAPKREKADIAELLESSVRLLRPSLAKRSIELRVEVARDVHAFDLDTAQMRQVVTNLVANAAEAIESGGTIVVRASHFPEGQGLILSVQDDGPGIPAEIRGELFEPFFTTKFSGTGLGLAVVNSLIRQHGGRVELQSEPGRGSTFFVLLPELDTGNGGIADSEA